jgi:uncharacterized phiE125 gp8 family phage protein
MSVDSTIALVTLAQARLALKVPAATVDAVQDAALEDMINRASAFANKWTGRWLLLKSYTEYYDGDGGNSLMLKNYPVDTLTSVHDDPLRVFGASTLIAASDYILDAAGGIIRLWNNAVTFLQGRANIKVVYTAGYPLASVPYDIQEAVLMIVQHQYKRVYQDQRIGLASETIGDHTMQYTDDAIPKKAKEVLERYRLKHSANYGHV